MKHRIKAVASKILGLRAGPGLVADRTELKEAALVDTDITPAVVERQRKYASLRIIRGDLGDRSILDQIGKVDAVFFFDTLLHQVKPAWNEILRM